MADTGAVADIGAMESTDARVGAMDEAMLAATPAVTPGVLTTGAERSEAEVAFTGAAASTVGAASTVEAEATAEAEATEVDTGNGHEKLKQTAGSSSLPAVFVSSGEFSSAGPT